MATSPAKPGPLLIRKYSNRRFYDTSRSCNVTLEELHGLIADGWDLRISDSRTDEDLTNAVLTQLILEHHSSKLAIFPAPILHQIIRTQQQFLGGIVEQFFRQTLEAQRTTQEQWARFVQNTLGFTPPGALPSAMPVDWMRSFLGPFGAGQAAPPATLETDAGEVEGLRRQLDELSRRIDAMTKPKDE